ncbi:hypothetical protein RND81_14G208800 [Saponaria officinalis]|uniref:Uncharacterized protein n=1 Tax=Saponaria officinalis TaxID=3572 RepID=A0AAW1GSX3_SAPOF
MSIPKPVRYLFQILLLVCLAPVIYAFVTIVTLAILPLILVAFLVLRLVQFVVRCNVLKKYFPLKVLMRYWILVVALLLLIEVGLFYPIAKFVPGVKLVTIIGLSITMWIKLICILVGIYLINLVIWFFTAVILAHQMDNGNDKCRNLVVEAVSEIFGCLLFLWAEVVVMNSVPTFKQSKIFGVYTRKWIEVSLFVLIGYDMITLLTHIVVCYVVIGIKRSIIFILSAVMLLVTWVLYFDDHLNTPENKRILQFGTWTLVSFLICSLFWLIKSFILLYWEAHAMYNRLHSKIADIRKQLYFLVILSNFHDLPVFKTPGENSNATGCGSSKTPFKRKVPWVVLKSGSNGDVRRIFDGKTVREKLISRTGTNASIHDIHQAAEQILAAQYSLSKEDTSGYLGHVQRDSDEDWKMLLELLPSVHPTQQEVKTWMEILANTLLSENEVTKCLNQVISGLIIAATFIMWLLLSGLAKTNVLVLIASPLLAATFIFGDTCKSLFQGLIFVYIVHPFDVGDLCVVDDKLVSYMIITVSFVRIILLDSIRYLDTEKRRFTPHFHSVEFLETEDKAKLVVHMKHNIKAEGWTYFECLKEKGKRRFETAIHIADLINQQVPETETQATQEAAKGG